MLLKKNGHSHLSFIDLWSLLFKCVQKRENNIKIAARFGADKIRNMPIRKKEKAF